VLNRFAPRSFRTRISLLSMLVSGLALIVFGLPAWFLINLIGLQRIDDQVRQGALPHLGFIPDNRHWDDLAALLRYTHGATAERASFLLVKNRDGSIAYRTPSVPRALRPERFPAPGTAASGMFLPPRPPPGGPPRPPGLPPPLARLRWPLAYTWRADDHTWRMAVLGNEFQTVIIGVDLASHQAQMRRVTVGFLAALPLALLLAAGGSWLLAGRALRPVAALTAAAGAITARGLDQRLTTAGEDEEFARLINVFNAMLDRLQRSFEQATRFSADAAHELKTPLTILQGELEQGLQGAAVGSPEQRRYGDLLEEVRRLKLIIRKLLLLSLADAGQLEPNPRRLNLSGMVAALGEDVGVLGPALTVETTVAPDLWVNGDAELLEQVLQNLGSNAVKYNRPGGTVQVRLARHGSQAELTVSNTGPGIPPEDRERVFERFYRADKARGRQVEGVGLGLSLAREIARAHHGDLLLAEARAGLTTFKLVLPLAPDAPAPTSAANPPPGSPSAPSAP